MTSPLQPESPPFEPVSLSESVHVLERVATFIATEERRNEVSQTASVELEEHALAMSAVLGVINHRYADTPTRHDDDLNSLRYLWGRATIETAPPAYLRQAEAEIKTLLDASAAIQLERVVSTAARANDFIQRNPGAVLMRQANGDAATVAVVTVNNKQEYFPARMTAHDAEGRLLIVRTSGDTAGCDIDHLTSTLVRSVLKAERLDSL